jgi:hypothetical protein
MFQDVVKCSKIFKHVLECSQMFQHVQECSRMFQNLSMPVNSPHITWAMAPRIHTYIHGHGREAHVVEVREALYGARAGRIHGDGSSLECSRMF